MKKRRTLELRESNPLFFPFLWFVVKVSSYWVLGHECLFAFLFHKIRILQLLTTLSIWEWKLLCCFRTFMFFVFAFTLSVNLYSSCIQVSTLRLYHFPLVKSWSCSYLATHFKDMSSRLLQYYTKIQNTNLKHILLLRAKNMRKGKRTKKDKREREEKRKVCRIIKKWGWLCEGSKVNKVRYSFFHWRNDIHLNSSAYFQG